MTTMTNPPPPPKLYNDRRVPINPYRASLAALAVILLIVGLAVLLGSQSGDDYYDDGSTAGQTAGVLLLGAGGTLLVAWLAVSALLWRPPGPGGKSVSQAIIDRVEGT